MRSGAVTHYLDTGSSDLTFPAWSGDIFERAKRGHAELVGALVHEVKRRAGGRLHPAVPSLDMTPWTRRKLTPMVSGLFPQVERERVLTMFEKSVVFLTTDNIERVLREQSWLRTAWDLANLFLGSVRADLLGPDAPSILGLSEETTCYVGARYFEERGRTEDFVIHEAAHVFHNCKRSTVGLPESRAREWLLPIAFGKRETFAYSCEAYGSIMENATSRAERIALADEFSREAHRLTEETIEPDEVADIVRAACEARSGWRVILGRCAPERPAQRKPGAVAGTAAR